MSLYDDLADSADVRAILPANRNNALGKPTEDETLLESPAAPTSQTEAPPPFNRSDTWRVLRIQSEFVEGFDALAAVGPAVTLFGSARVKPDDPVYAAAVETARLLGQSGLSIITGGGPGIMEAANKGAREAGVLSIGLNIELPFEQGVNPYVDLDIDFRYFFVRKTMLVKYAQGFVIFPGGFGTMDELFESLTLIQTGKIRNFPIVLYSTPYWQGLLDWLRNTQLAEGKIGPADLDLLHLADTPQQACDIILAGIQGLSDQQGREARARATTRAVMGTK